MEETEEGEEDAREREREGRGVEVYNATIAGCDRSYELRAGNLGTVYVNLREGDAGEAGGRDEREEGWSASEGEGLYRYVPAAVVCNIMITLSLPAPGFLPSSPSLSVHLAFSPFLSLPSYAYTRLPGGHPLSAAMLPGNMIIVIICTLLRSYPPDSSPLRNSPVILPE